MGRLAKMKEANVARHGFSKDEEAISERGFSWRAGTDERQLSPGLSQGALIVTNY